MANDNTKSYPIIWARARSILHTKDKGEEWLGVCGHSKRVCKIRSPKDMLSILIIQNLYITKDKCEEAEGCLDMNCPFNKTTWESFKRREGLPGNMPPPANFGVLPIDYNRSPSGGLNDFSWLFKDEHSGGILMDEE